MSSQRSQKGDAPRESSQPSKPSCKQNKKICQDTQGCQWVTGKGCRSTKPKEKSPCTKQVKQKCENNVMCQWKTGRGCRLHPVEDNVNVDFLSFPQGKKK